jgi:RimJ/RimL family protein N-acetyltransferase
LGAAVDFGGARPPAREALRGAHVLVRPVNPDTDADPLFTASHPPDGDRTIWTYLPDGPYESVKQLQTMLTWASTTEDALYFTVAPLPDEQPLGMAAYLRITPEAGAIEIGHIWFGAQLKRTTAATEAIYLLVRHAFEDLGYRRVEWKCNALNAASRAAAARFGFTFEGIFRKHMVVKGRNRDTAWFAIVDDEWPAIRSGYEAWLASENLDGGGMQRNSLSSLIAGTRQAG